MNPKKSNKIIDVVIVRLQQILKKWRGLANSLKTAAVTISSSTSKSITFLRRRFPLSDREGGSSNNVNVPKGSLAVCVGEEQKRFIIPTECLSHQAFHLLLQEAEEEFGFHQTGVLRIPCEVSVFETILKIVDRKKDKFNTQEFRIGIEEIMGYCSADNQFAFAHHPESPMCR